jgi:hypothetical protein
MKNFMKILKGTCWANWLFIVMLGGLAFISITTQLSGCGNKSDLVLPINSTDQTPVTTKNN